jgi:hypothetical protein
MIDGVVIILDVNKIRPYATTTIIAVLKQVKVKSGVRRRLLQPAKCAGFAMTSR